MKQTLSDRSQEIAEGLISRWDGWEADAAHDGVVHQSTDVEYVSFKGKLAAFVHQILQQIILDAANICDRRASSQERSMAVYNEAIKCGMQIRHELLCGDGELVCIRCDGKGCDHCDYEGIRKSKA